MCFALSFVLHFGDVFIEGAALIERVEAGTEAETTLKRPFIFPFTCQLMLVLCRHIRVIY